MLRLMLVVVTGLFLAAPAAAGPALVPDEEIARIIAERVDVQRQATGIVVGVIDPAGRRIIAHGTFGLEDTRPVEGDTVFEIGSVTKVFTTLLLADAVQRGEVALDDPIGRYLPADLTLPERGGKQITFLDLATHTSGLPRLPDNLLPADPEDPYADYDVEALYAFLSGYTLQRDIGAQYEYSNLGTGLLGHVLSVVAGADYETVLRERILLPLGLEDTAITLTDEQRARMAGGHDFNLRPVPNWNLNVLAGSGALRSTANELLDFLAVAMGDVPNSLASAMAETLVPRRPTGVEEIRMGLGWEIYELKDDQIITKNGGTAGFASFIGFRPGAKAGVVVLANAATWTGTTNIGMHLLEPLLPLEAPPPPHVKVELPPEALDAYVGTYELAPDYSITVFREGNALIAQPTAQDAAEIVPMGEHRFFHTKVDAEFSFEVGADGKATGLVLHQGGNDMPGRRVD